MISVLIISPTYTQMQALKTILHREGQQFLLTGIADNSVLGMSLIESSKPDVVIMPFYMTFWNAEDLINYLLPKGMAPLFILLGGGTGPKLSQAAASRVVAILPEDLPSEQDLTAALQAAARSVLRAGREEAEPPHNPTVQHSLEVMELLMGLIPPGIGEAQKRFGRLKVGGSDCWLLLGAPRGIQREPFNFFLHLEELESAFSRLKTVLLPLGSCELCIYQECNLCILLADGQRQEPDWNQLIVQINDVLGTYHLPPLLFEISDVPLPLAQWHGQCRELLRLRDMRFFYSPVFLQPKIRRVYQIPVTQGQIHEKLSALSVAVQDQKKEELIGALRSLEDMVCHSLSQELYSFVATQLTVQYGHLCFRYNLRPAEEDYTVRFRQFSNVEEAFSAFSSLYLDLFEQMHLMDAQPNQTIQKACAYIDEHLEDRLTLELLAEYVHVSPTYFCKLFKRETGCAFSRYLNEKRIARALELLETPYRIIDIAGMVGFENAKYFSHVFKDKTGKTPQEYRQSLHRREQV